MTNQERQQLSNILEKLETMRGYAPMQTTYSQGRVKANVAGALLDVIAEVKALLEVEDASEKSSK